MPLKLAWTVAFVVVSPEIVKLTVPVTGLPTASEVKVTVMVAAVMLAITGCEGLVTSL